MKKQTVQDERVLAQNLKIGSDTGHLLLLILFISILIQKYLLNASFAQYAVELIAFLGAAFYIIMRNVTLGNDIFQTGKKAKNMVVTTSVFCGIIVTIINGIFNYLKYAEHYTGSLGFFMVTLAITFISATAAAFIIFFIVHLLNEKKKKQIEKKLNEDENKGDEDGDKDFADLSSIK